MFAYIEELKQRIEELEKTVTMLHHQAESAALRNIEDEHPERCRGYEPAEFRECEEMDGRCLTHNENLTPILPDCGCNNE